jgi:uncharacterized repeat protein (TIGR01451 family)
VTLEELEACDEKQNLPRSTSALYMITNLGLQIDVGAPGWAAKGKSVDKTTTFLGDILTYTVGVQNNGTVDSTSVVFTDVQSPGTTFVMDSFKLNGNPMLHGPAHPERELHDEHRHFEPGTHRVVAAEAGRRALRPRSVGRASLNASSRRRPACRSAYRGSRPVADP